tara:strand:+ start:4063 stop:4989 length:927 start_codon:yes stop_codon:yes gene_type:complete
VKVYHHIEDFQGANNATVTTGTFDGVHIGHRKILNRLKEVAQSVKGETVLFTFHPHPRLVLQPDIDLKLLSTPEEKIMLLEQVGIDHLIIHPFTKEFSRLSSIEFVRDYLVNQIGTKKLVIGYDHHFGRNREGSFEHLLEYGPTYGFDVEEIPALDVDHVNVSSTKIRTALSEGDVQTAATYLSYPYRITGTVVEGDKIGRSIGFPTANINVDFSNKLIPSDGVYAVLATIDGISYKGMLNIGNRPTVDTSHNKRIEVNLFQFDNEIYGKTVTLSFIAHVRSEKKYESLEALKTQLSKDKEQCINLLQ